MASPTRPPWQFNVQNPDTQLPWDPNMPYADPAIGDQRQPVLQAQQSFQDAVQGQQQASQPQGLAGVFSNPIFQAAVPTALTALSAIFPRHMAIAGPVGMAGYRTLEDQNQFQQAQRQSVAANTAKQAQGNFDQQRFKYAVSHNYGLDPAIADSVFEAYKSDPKKGAEELQKAIVMQKQHDAAKGALAAPPSNLPMGGKETYKDPYGPEATFSGPPELTGDLGALKSQFPDLNAVELIKKKNELRPKTLEEQNQEAYITEHPGTTPDQYAQHMAFVHHAPQEADKNQEKAETKDKMNAILDMVDKRYLPVMSMARSPKMLGELAQANEERVKSGLPPVDVNKILFEQNAIQAKLANLQTGEPAKIINAATTMNATLDNMADAYDKVEAKGLIPTNVKVINEAYLHVLAQTGDPDASRLLTNFLEAKQRNNLFINNGFAPSKETEAATNGMFSVGLPRAAFKASIAAVQQNARDIVNVATQTPVVGIDQESPTLQHLNLGPTAKPTNMPGMAPQAAPSSGAVAPELLSKYKSKVDLLKAAKAGEVDVPTARAIAKAKGWRQ